MTDPRATIFISRKLSADSVLLQLKKDGFDIIDRSLVVFEAVHFDDVPNTNWLFFYSKKGIEYFLSGIKKGLDLSTYKTGFFGTQTAEHWLQQTNIRPTFIGDGVPENVINAFNNVYSTHETVTFVKASNSKNTVQQNLPEERCFELVVYNNSMLKDFTLPTCDFLVFTSSLNAKAYAQQTPFLPSQTIIAIGESTKETILRYTNANIYLPKTTSERGIYDIISSIDRTVNL